MTSSAIMSVLQSGVGGALLVTAHPHRAALTEKSQRNLIMKTLFAWIVWAMCASNSLSCHAQETFVLRFDDLQTSVPVRDQYAQFGIHFSSGDAGVFPGLSNGDLGGWGLEGTAGPYFEGFNGHPSDSMTLTFDTPITAFSLDASRANGSIDRTYFILRAYYRGSLLSSTGATLLGSVNQWTTFSVSRAAIDSIQFNAYGIRSIPPPIRHLGVFGIDNVRFTMVPEPSILTLFIASGFGALLARSRQRCKSLPNEVAALDRE